VKLFIVEDLPMTIMNFVTAVGDNNWSYYSFSPKNEAVASDEDLRRFLTDVCEQRPDVVILDAALTSREAIILDDLELGGKEISEESLSGFRYCRTLASERFGIPIVFLTKSCGGPVARTAMRVGADRVLTKRTIAGQLIREIEDLVKSRTPHDSEFYWMMRDKLDVDRAMWQGGQLRQALDRFFLNDSLIRRFGMFTASLRSIISLLFQGDTCAEKKLMLSLVKSQIILSLADPRLRDHVKHTGNVFWMGYRLLHEITELKEPQCVRGNVPALYEGSGLLTPREQLFYAWTLAALFHDCGYVDERQDQLAGLVSSLLQNANIKHNNVRDEPSWARNMQLLRNFVESMVGNKHFLYHFIDTVIALFGSDLARRDKRGIKSTLLDHGFLSAHRLLDLVPLDGLDSQKKNVVLHAALAIACHNYTEMLHKWDFPAQCRGSLPIGQFPVCSLLAFCDSVQTWDRELEEDPAITRTEAYDSLLERLVLSDIAYISGSEICEFTTSCMEDGSYYLSIRLRYYVEAAGGVKEVCESLGEDIQSWINSGRLRDVCEMTGIQALLHGQIEYELPMLAGNRIIPF